MTTCPSCGIAGNNFICPNHISCSGVNPNLDLVPPPQTIVNWINSNSAQLFAEIGRLNILLNERNKEFRELSVEYQRDLDLQDKLDERNKEIERLRSLMPPDDTSFLGKAWSLIAEKLRLERDALREELAERDRKIEWLRRERTVLVAWLRKMTTMGSPITQVYLDQMLESLANWELAVPWREYTDQFGRTLPLKGHHKDCGYGKDGWSLCTCDELEGKKTCEHGNTECKRCGIGQPVPTIKTPEGKPLLPAAEFAAIQIEENKEVGLTECNFQRRTGRTTAMVLEALEFVKQNNSALVTINVHNFTMKKRIKELLKHYADESGVQHGQLSRVRVRLRGEYSPSAALNLYDNVLDDMKETKPTRDPRQDLKVGKHVRFEIEGIIKERQSAGIFQDEDGSDFEPIQYAVKDSINGMTYYVGYHQIIKVIGKEE